MTLHPVYKSYRGRYLKEKLYEMIDYINFTEDGVDPVEKMGIGAKNHIEKWLKEANIQQYKLTKRYYINVYNSVIVSSMELGDLPKYINFNHIMGEFHIKNNNLTTLRGCPFSLNGSFIASNNNLASLEFGPKIVKNSYAVSYNRLESLYGLAKSIGDSLFLNNNNLKNLEYIPILIKGSLNIQNNPIDTLKYFPDEIEGHLHYTPSEIITKENILNRCKVWGHLIEQNN